MCRVAACRTNRVDACRVNYFPGSDILAERNDLPDSDIIEYRHYINALTFHMIFRTWNESPKAK